MKVLVLLLVAVPALNALCLVNVSTSSFSLKSFFSSKLVSSVRSSSGYHGLIEIRSKATFSNFSNSSDSKVKVKVKGPNMCYIFEKHWIQGYLI